MHFLICFPFAWPPPCLASIIHLSSLQLPARLTWLLCAIPLPLAARAVVFLDHPSVGTLHCYLGARRGCTCVALVPSFSSQPRALPVLHNNSSHVLFCLTCARPLEVVPAAASDLGSASCIIERHARMPAHDCCKQRTQSAPAGTLPDKQRGAVPFSRTQATQIRS